MRTIWNGSISFGLVNIPVGLALATKPAARQSDVSFRTLHRECLTPIKQKRWCPTHEREVERDELVKGWEVSKGEFVVVEDADLEAIMLLRARAVENGFYVAAPAQVGETGIGRPSYGRSLIVDPWGTVLAQAPDEETVISAELDRAWLEEVRRRLPSLSQRRPEAYRWPAPA